MCNVMLVKPIYVHSMAAILNFVQNGRHSIFGKNANIDFRTPWVISFPKMYSLYNPQRIPTKLNMEPDYTWYANPYNIMRVLITRSFSLHHWARKWLNEVPRPITHPFNLHNWAHNWGGESFNHNGTPPPLPIHTMRPVLITRPFSLHHWAQND